MIDDDDPRDEALDLDEPGWEALALALPPSTPSAGLRGRLLASVAAPAGRFAPMIDRLAALIDAGAERAEALLEGLGDPGRWLPMLPGIGLVHIEGGPAVAGADVGFVRIEAGVRFPFHRHLGDERVLVLQGEVLDDSGERARAGDLLAMPAGGAHAFRAGDAEALIYAVVVFGVEIPGVELPSGG